ncbi:MAG: hypothetical protein NTX50_05290 [Candidatus Sumerlaeota bacterium]|nr:hypothetical protein [Candidatus Sumerlaeota bacterium]
MSTASEAYKELLQEAQCYARFLKDIGLEFAAPVGDAAPSSEFQVPSSGFTVPSSGFRVPSSEFTIPKPEFNGQGVGARGQALELCNDISAPKNANTQSPGANPQPPAINPQSAIRNSQSLSINPQSAIRNPQSAIRNTQSLSDNPQSAIRNLQSPAVNPQSAIRNPQSSMSSQEQAQRVAQIGAEVAACIACRLHAGRRNVVPGEGNPSAELMFIGEGPGFDEDRLGRPFVGRAGQKLDQMIAYLGLPRAQVYICNIVKCRPPGNRTPAPDEAETCRPFLERQIETVAPRVICLLGATALKFLTGNLTASITSMRGKWIEYRGIPALPTFHPSYLLRDPTREDRLRVMGDMDAIRARMQELGCRIGPKPAKGGKS